MFIDLFRKHFVLRSPLSSEECASRLHDRIEGTKSVSGYVDRDELSLRQYLGRSGSVFLSATFSSDGDQTQLDCISGVLVSEIVPKLIWFVVFLGLFYALTSRSVGYRVHGDAYDAKLFGEPALIALFLALFIYACCRF